MFNVTTLTMTALSSSPLFGESLRNSWYGSSVEGITIWTLLNPELPGLLVYVSFLLVPHKRNSTLTVEAALLVSTVGLHTRGSLRSVHRPRHRRVR